MRRVPWRLRLPGRADGPAPLLVALHGKGDRAARFEAEALEALPEGWALLVPSAPIPRDRGPALGEGSLGDSWYVYDGDTPRFRESLDAAERHLVAVLRAARRAAGRGVLGPAAILGFSQGAYLGGIVAVRRPREFRAAVLVAGRLKVEILGARFRAARRLRLLALHGARDEAVRPGPSRESFAGARAAGLDAEFREMDGGHKFTPAMRRAAREWLDLLDGNRERRAPVKKRASRSRRRKPSG